MIFKKYDRLGMVVVNRVFDFDYEADAYFEKQIKAYARLTKQNFVKLTQSALGTRVKFDDGTIFALELPDRI